MHTHARKIVHAFVQTHLKLIHAARREVWAAAVFVVMNGRWLSLMRLSRGLMGAGSLKAAAKRIDRLIGNTRIVQEAQHIERALIQRLCPVAGLAVIAVDWSSVSAGGKFVELRASLVHAGMGRGLTICHRVYPLSKLGNGRCEQAFLRDLHKHIPAGQQVVLITDAGFRRPWFKEVEKLGWMWIGRVRSGVQVSFERNGWQDAKDYFGRATGKARRWDNCELTRRYRFGCDMVLVKHRHIGGKRYRRAGHGPTPKAQAEAKRSAHEPWLLACSTWLRGYAVEQIVAWYARRMQIEENFRDHKSPEYGMGLSFSQSRSRQRLHALLLIGTLAAFLMWHIGQLAEAEGIHKHYKSSTRVARELSVITLARELCMQNMIMLSNPALETLRERLGIPS